MHPVILTQDFSNNHAQYFIYQVSLLFAGLAVIA